MAKLGSESAASASATAVPRMVLPPFTLEMNLLPMKADAEAYRQAGMKVDQTLKFVVKPDDAHDCDQPGDLELVTYLHQGAKIPYHYKRVTLLMDTMPMPWVNGTTLELPVCLLDRGQIQLRFHVDSKSPPAAGTVEMQATPEAMEYTLMPQFFPPQPVGRHWARGKAGGEARGEAAASPSNPTAPDAKSDEKHPVGGGAGGGQRPPPLVTAVVRKHNPWEFEPAFEHYETTRTPQDIAKEEFVFLDFDAPLAGAAPAPKGERSGTLNNRKILCVTPDRRHAAILTIQKIVNKDTHEPLTFYVNRVYGVTAIQLLIGV